METVSFTQMKDGICKEYEFLARLEKPFLQLTADLVLSEFRHPGELTREGYKISAEIMDYNRAHVPIAMGRILIGL